MDNLEITKAHNYRRNYPGFVPTEIPGLLMYLDATIVSSLSTTGLKVNQWNDLSGNNNHVSNTGVSRPDYGTRTINGKPCVDFDGTTWLFRSDTMGLLGNPDLTVIFYAEFDTTTPNRFFGIGNGSVAGGVISLASDTSFRFQNGFQSYTPMQMGTPEVESCYRSAGSQYQDGVWRRGSVQLNKLANSNPTFTPNITSVSTTIGALSSTGSLPCNFAVTRVLVYNNILSQSQLIKAESWMAS